MDKTFKAKLNNGAFLHDAGFFVEHVRPVVKIKQVVKFLHEFIRLAFKVSQPLLINLFFPEQFILRLDEYFRLDNPLGAIHNQVADLLLDSDQFLLDAFAFPFLIGYPAFSEMLEVGIQGLLHFARQLHPGQEGQDLWLG